MCERRVPDRADVAVRKEEAIAVRVFGCFGIMSKDGGEVERGEDVRHPEGAGGVAGPRLEEHADEVLSDRVRFPFELHGSHVLVSYRRRNAKTTPRWGRLLYLRLS